MIVKGIIEKVIDQYSAKVRIPIWDGVENYAGSATTDELTTATICNPAGVRQVFKPGEVVYIGFEQDDHDNPVILGVLGRANSDSTSEIEAQTLSIDLPQTFEDEFIEPLNVKIDEAMANGGGGDPGVELTQAEYDALPESKLTDGVNYYITDASPIASHIGMIIQSTTLDTMEKVIAIYGGTTWTRLDDMFLVGAGTTYAVNSTGGEATHTLTVEEIPAHSHSMPVDNYDDGNFTNPYGHAQAGDSGGVTTSGITYDTGGGQAHNNLPPYKAVYIWERTA